MGRRSRRIKQAQLSKKKIEHVLPCDKCRQKIVFIQQLWVEVGNVHADVLTGRRKPLPPTAQQDVAERRARTRSIPVINADKSFNIESHEQIS